MFLSICTQKPQENKIHPYCMLSRCEAFIGIPFIFFRILSIISLFLLAPLGWLVFIFPVFMTVLCECVVCNYSLLCVCVCCVSYASCYAFHQHRLCVSACRFHIFLVVFFYFPFKSQAILDGLVVCVCVCALSAIGLDSDTLLSFAIQRNSSLAHVNHLAFALYRIAKCANE